MIIKVSWNFELFWKSKVNIKNNLTIPLDQNSHSLKKSITQKSNRLSIMKNEYSLQGGKISDHFDQEDDFFPSPGPALIPSSQVVSSLTESTKNMDAAANIAQRLGALMSRVATQQASSQKSPTPSNSPAPSPRSRFLPVDELARRASILKGVAQEAHRSLQDIELHSVGVGGESPARSPGRILSSTWSKPAAATSGRNSKEKIHRSVRDTKSGQTERGMSTQTDKVVEQLTRSSSSTGQFEFVKDMSYTDQLMLKKLRSLKASWTEDDNGIGAAEKELEMENEPPSGTGDQLMMSQNALAATIASSRNKK